MKILMLDIETAPNTAHVWGLWNENIPLARLIESGYTLCWGAKWYGEDDLFFSSLGTTGPKTMLREVHKLLSMADAVVHYNGTRFDIPTLNKEFIVHGMTPPAPYKQIDLLKTCRKQFRFASNKLAYVAEALGVGAKTDAGGFDTWIGCMNNDPEAWDRMRDYNLQDVLLLERVYDKVKPWIVGHLNFSVVEGTRTCPNCGSTTHQRRGYVYTSAYRYPRFRCNDCGAWFRGAKSETQPPADKTLPLGA